MSNYTRKGALLLSLLLAMSSVSAAATAVDVTANDESTAVVAEQSTDHAVSVQSGAPDNINIEDDDGYLWNGYYNEDGTITLTGTQELWGNAYTDKGSESSKDALIIPESIGGKTVTRISSYKEQDNFDTAFSTNLIHKIVLPETVTEIEPYMSGDVGLFGGFSELEELDLGGANPEANDVFGRASEGYSVPLKKLTVAYGVRWNENNARHTAMRDGIETLTIRQRGSLDFNYTGEYANVKTLSVAGTYNKLRFYSMPNLTTLNLPDAYNELSLSDLPNLTMVNSPNQSVADAYITALRNCPKVNITKVQVAVPNVEASEQTKMFDNSPVEEITLDFCNEKYYQISKAIFCGASKLKAIHVKNQYEQPNKFYTDDGILYWKNSQNNANDLFFYPAAKNPGGTYVVPETLTCMYVFAFYGSQLNKVYFPESLPQDYYWDYESYGNWYREEQFPEAKGEDWFYIGDMSTVIFSAVPGTWACYWPDSLEDGHIPVSRQEIRQGSTYNLSYKLKGGTNDAANPTSYVVGEEPVELKPAYREGYTFDGWKDENGLWIYETPTRAMRYSDGKLHRFEDRTFTACWKKISKMEIDGPSKTIAAGKTIRLNVESSYNPVENEQLKWSTSNKKIATVNADGVVKFAKNAGGKSVTVTAKLRSNSKVKATYKIKCVKYAVTKVKITGKKTTMREDETQTLTVKVSGKKGAYKAIAWSSNDPDVTVNSKGKVKVEIAQSEPFTATITAMAKDGSGKKDTYDILVVSD